MVFHTASPFKLDVEKPQKDLVEPALEGTRNVLQEVNRTPSVQRVVLTSSCAAIYGDNADLEATPEGRFTEKIWNTTSSLDHQPYAYSKTVAEKEAWRIHDAQHRWEMVTINPSLVLGPGINPYATSESFTIIRQLGDGSLKSGVPRMGFGVVDVRDVAEAHFRAAFTPGARGRYIISAHPEGMGRVVAQIPDTISGLLVNRPQASRPSPQPPPRPSRRWWPRSRRRSPASCGP